MARYRKVEVKTWNDGKFRELTPIPPCGQGLWLWFLTGTRTTNIPGVVIGTDQVMAAELRWPLEAFREAFREAFDKGMAKGDWQAGLVWLPNASRPGDNRNKPESPNVIRSWRDTWEEIPECPLKLEVWQQLKAFAEAFGKGFGEAFLEACRKPWVKALPNQEQEQEQDIEPPLPPRGLNGAKAPSGRRPREITNRSLECWRGAVASIDRVKGTDLTWQAVDDELADPLSTDAIRSAGGHKNIADRSQFTQSALESRFRERYEQLLEERVGEDAAGSNGNERQPPAGAPFATVKA